MNTKPKKCIFVVATPDYAQELCALTLPTIERYAERIGADFKIISERKFPSYPVNYERLQIYTLGQEYEWNINIDADILIGDDLCDPTTFLPHHTIGLVMKFMLNEFIKTDHCHYFQRDGRNIGVVDTFVVTHRLTHSLWEPLPGEFQEYQSLFKDGNIRRISEYCLSRNLAKYGLAYAGLFRPNDKILHLNYTSDKNQDAVAAAKNQLKLWADMRDAKTEGST